MSEIDSLFKEALEDNNIFIPSTLAEKIFDNSEKLFSGYNHDEQSRQSDEEIIKEKIKELEIEIHKNKNIKNHKLSHLNAKRAERRKVIKRKIADLNLKLQNIDMEREKE
jgi:hypothetical protein